MAKNKNMRDYFDKNGSFMWEDVYRCMKGLDRHTTLDEISALTGLRSSSVYGTFDTIRRNYPGVKIHVERNSYSTGSNKMPNRYKLVIPESKTIPQEKECRPTTTEPCDVYTDDTRPWTYKSLNKKRYSIRTEKKDNWVFTSLDELPSTVTIGGRKCRLSFTVIE